MIQALVAINGSLSIDDLTVLKLCESESIQEFFLISTHGLTMSDYP